MTADYDTTEQPLMECDRRVNTASFSEIFEENAGFYNVFMRSRIVCRYDLRGDFANGRSEVMGRRCDCRALQYPC